MSEKPTLKEVADAHYQWAMDFIDDRHGEGFAAENPAVVIELAKWLEMLRGVHALKGIKEELYNIDINLME